MLEPGPAMSGSNLTSPSARGAERLSAQAIADCIQVLEAICADRTELAYLELELRNRLMTAAGRVSRPERAEQKVLSREVRRKEKREVREADRAVLAQAGIRQKRLEPVYITPDRPSLSEAGGGAFQLGTATPANVDADPTEELPPL